MQTNPINLNILTIQEETFRNIKSHSSNTSCNCIAIQYTTILYDFSCNRVEIRQRKRPQLWFLNSHLLTDCRSGSLNLAGFRGLSNNLMSLIPQFLTYSYPTTAATWVLNLRVEREISNSFLYLRNGMYSPFCYANVRRFRQIYMAIDATSRIPTTVGLL